MIDEKKRSIRGYTEIKRKNIGLKRMHVKVNKMIDIVVIIYIEGKWNIYIFFFNDKGNGILYIHR